MKPFESQDVLHFSFSPENKLREALVKGVWRQRLVNAGLIFGLWTLVGLFFASQIYFYSVNTEYETPFSKALVWQLSAVYLIALATPLILWLSKRFRLDSPRWLRSVIVHLIASIIIGWVLTAGHAILDGWFSGRLNSLSLQSFWRIVYVNLDKNLLNYWLIVFISNAVNYYRRYRESELAATKLAAQLSEAQLNALKMQLHPHFLFNTLHSISSLLSKDTETARRMITRLGDFLRLTLENSGSQEIELCRELEFLTCYLEIERIRFSDRLTVKMEVDAKVLNCLVPNLILQPIVENSIRHAIAPRSTAGTIEVKASQSNGMLRLQIKDNGPGIKLDLIPKKEAQRGIGLSNTRNRLHQLYGDDAHFELINSSEGGLSVTLEIPLVKEGETQSNAA